MTIQQLAQFESCDDTNVILALFKKKNSEYITNEHLS